MKHYNVPSEASVWKLTCFQCWKVLHLEILLMYGKGLTCFQCCCGLLHTTIEALLVSQQERPRTVPNLKKGKEYIFVKSWIHVGFCLQHKVISRDMSVFSSPLTWPCQNGTTSSFLPWITSTGVSVMVGARSILGNMSQGMVKRKWKATRKTESSGLWP
jgi:hypothetical protein